MKTRMIIQVDVEVKDIEQLDAQFRRMSMTNGEIVEDEVLDAVRRITIIGKAYAIVKVKRLSRESRDSARLLGRRLDGN